MKAVKIAKLLNVLSYIGLLAVVVCYFFVKFKSLEHILFALLGVCILRMAGASVKAAYFEKENTKLKEDNLFMQRRIDELQTKKDESRQD